MKNFIVCLGLFFVTHSLSALDGKWVDYEILGNRKATRAEIIKKLPIKLGTPYVEDLVNWKKKCAELVPQFGWAAVECSAVRFADGRSYFVVDVIEKGEEYRNQFRPAPHEEVVIANIDVQERFKKLNDRLWKLFAEGKPPAENVTKDFLDYNDLEMHQLAVELRRIVPPHRKSILKGLAESKSVEVRMMAADLLNWAGKTNESILAAYRYLDDPNAGVRNQLTRFMMHYMNRLPEDASMKPVIDTLALQLERPSHGDRNKAIFSLLELAKSKPGLKSYLKEKVAGIAQRIANQSILENVKEPAREFLALVEN